jgi:ABC-type branched-subunit amino acid transport system substrate-binding protein
MTGLPRSPATARSTRRALLATAAATGALAGLPRPLRAQPPTVKIGAVHPVTGGLAEIGRACRLGAQMAVDAVNAAGGIQALGGARLELVLGDTENKPDVARREAERVINAGAPRPHRGLPLRPDLAHRLGHEGHLPLLGHRHPATRTRPS